MNSQSQGRTPCNCIGKFPKSSNENFKAFCNSFKSHVKNFDPNGSHPSKQKQEILNFIKCFSHSKRLLQEFLLETSQDYRKPHIENKLSTIQDCLKKIEVCYSQNEDVKLALKDIYTCNKSESVKSLSFAKKLVKKMFTFLQNDNSNLSETNMDSLMDLLNDLKDGIHKLKDISVTNPLMDTHSR